ncbi:helix-turn-helix domain-containing protein [Erwinia sp. S43]|uniref:winged helix-turn-helix domain-containing protein n=1 Tax=Erwinia sp. S43 TaxID=2769339 RepID=UPI00190BA612|nr:helix-turn-helix domain-containing protein [Erwinia sp. S43]
MNYLINGTLKYNSYDGTLYLIDGSVDMLTLSRIANELLCLMVENNNNPLSREHILNDLWTKKGLSSSGNNLNNYMSILRRALSNLGFSDVIITIPRHGFMLSADVEIMSDDNDEGEIFTGGNKQLANSLINDDSLNKKINFIFLFIRKGNVSLLTVLLLVLLISPLLFFHFLVRSDYSFKINNCNVYLLDNSGVKRKTADDFSVVKNHVVKYKINCGRKADIFYWSGREVSVNESSTGKEILAYCDNSSGGECVNYGLLK